MPPTHVCTLSISHSSRPVPAGGSALQVGVGRKDQAQPGIILCTEEVKEACCCLPQACWLFLGQGPAGYQLKNSHNPFTWLSWHP